MINKIKNKNKLEDSKILFSNFVSLSVLKGVNYILPLITFPYLVKVLGIEKFGLLSFATATIAYFNILTDYGFNLTATREVSIYRNNKEKLNEIFSSVMLIKFILMIISFLLLFILILSFNKFSKDWIVYILTFGMVIGQVLFPQWFFQGMERMKYITFLNIFAKIIFTILIFVFIHKENDYWKVPLINSLGFIIAGMMSIYIIIDKFKINFKLQSFETIKYYFIDGWYIFISRFYVSLYTNTNIFLLGFFTNNTMVGYYSITEKIVILIGGLFEPANQTIYPFLAKKYKENFNQFIELLKKISFVYLVVSFLFLIVSEIFKESIVQIITGENLIEIVSLLSIFLMRILTFPFGPLFSNTLIIMQRKKEFIKVMNYTVILDLLIVSPSIYFYSIKGLVYSFIFILFIHVLLLIYYVRKAFKEERL